MVVASRRLLGALNPPWRIKLAIAASWRHDGGVTATPWHPAMATLRRLHGGAVMSRAQCAKLASCRCRGEITAPRRHYGGAVAASKSHGGTDGGNMIPPWCHHGRLCAPRLSRHGYLLAPCGRHGGFDAPRRHHGGAMEPPWCRHGTSNPPWRLHGATMTASKRYGGTTALSALAIAPRWAQCAMATQ